MQKRNEEVLIPLLHLKKMVDSPNKTPSYSLELASASTRTGLSEMTPFSKGGSATARRTLCKCLAQRKVLAPKPPPPTVKSSVGQVAI